MQMDQTKLMEIEITKIRVNPFQPRRHFAIEELEELAISIKNIGIIQPPVVRALSDHFELISGERRVRAAQLAGLTRLMVIVKIETTLQSTQAALIENVQRVDLTAIEIARALNQLIQEYGFSQEELATRIGKKRSTVTNYLRLLTLPSEIQISVENESISMGHAKAILSLKTEREQLTLHQLIIEKDLSVRKAEETAIQMTVQEEPPKITEPSQDCHLLAYTRKLEELLGTKVEILGNMHKGSLKIEYYSLDDLNRIGCLMGLEEE